MVMEPSSLSSTNIDSLSSTNISSISGRLLIGPGLLSRGNESGAGDGRTVNNSSINCTY